MEVLPFFTIILLVCVGVVCLLALVVVGILIVIYNNLVKLKTLVEEAWSGIDVQLKKRFDLIPNLVNTVKGYASHEDEVFSKIAKYRSIVDGAETRDERVEAENMLSSTLKTLFAVSENYPELKANESFLDLQEQLSDIESELEGARRYYNGTVREFNIKIKSFPINLVAGMLNFSPEPFFEAETEARQNVTVDFSENA